MSSELSYVQPITAECGHDTSFGDCRDIKDSFPSPQFRCTLVHFIPAGLYRWAAGLESKSPRGVNGSEEPEFTISYLLGGGWELSQTVYFLSPTLQY